MRRAVVVATAAAVAIVARAPVAHACTCAVDAPAADLRRAHVVFVGTAMVADRPGEDNRPTLVTFAVREVYKGAVAKTTTVETPSLGGACGVPFVPGERYAVFAVLVDGVPKTDTCSGTTKDLGVLVAAGRPDPLVRYDGDGARLAPPPVPAPNRDARTGAIAAAALLLAAAAALLIVRMRGTGRDEPSG